MTVLSGSRGSSWIIVANSRQRSGTVRAIGPRVENWIQVGLRRSLAISPRVGRMPTTPLKAAGLRHEPPVSDPVAIGTMPQASATPDPPDEPAAERVGSNGLPVTP